MPYVCSGLVHVRADYQWTLALLCDKKTNKLILTEKLLPMILCFMALY